MKEIDLYRVVRCCGPLQQHERHHSLVRRLFVWMCLSIGSEYDGAQTEMRIRVDQFLLRASH